MVIETLGGEHWAEMEIRDMKDSAMWR